MSADLLRQAADAERDEWGSADTVRTYPKSSAIHLALADWLEATTCTLHCNARGLRDPYCSACEESGWDHECPPAVPCQHSTGFRHALTVARAILGGAS